MNIIVIIIFFTATSLGVNFLDAFAVEDHASAGASESLVGGGGDNVLKITAKNNNMQNNRERM